MSGVSRIEERVLAHLDEARLIEDLVELVQMPSITGSDAESELQHRQARALEESGFAVDTWAFDLGALRADPRFPGTEADRVDGYGVVGTFGGDGMPALVLQGHVDVVPAGDLSKWSGADPFAAAISNRTLYGRGACDMKAGVAANAAVARALEASGARLERPFGIHSVISEEDGGLGAFGTMLRGHTADSAVITEPTAGRIVTANAGALTFTITVHGLAAHASTRLEGFSAIDAFWPIATAIREIERERNALPDRRFLDNRLPYPISIGKLRSGDWASSVPDLLTAEGRLGVQLGEAPEAARFAFEAAITRANASDPWLADHPATIRWHGGSFASGALAAGHPLLEEVASCVADVHQVAPAVAAAPYGSDLRLYTGIGGIPTLHYGPGDVRFAHAPREQVELDEVVRVAETLLVLAVRRRGAHL